MTAWGPDGLVRCQHWHPMLCSAPASWLTSDRLRSSQPLCRSALHGCFGATLSPWSVCCPTQIWTIVRAITTIICGGEPPPRSYPMHSLTRFMTRSPICVKARLSIVLANKEEFLFSYEWSKGDICLWDNISILHKASEIKNCKRIMHRITIK